MRHLKNRNKLGVKTSHRIAKVSQFALVSWVTTTIQANCDNHSYSMGSFNT